MAKGGSFGYLVNVETQKAQANTKNLSKALGKQSKQAKKTGGSLKSMALKIGGLAIAYIGVSKALRAFSGLMKESFRLAAEQIKVERVLTLKYGESAKALFEQASALQKVTTFGDEVIIKGQGLLGFFNIQLASILKLTPALVDMAAAGFDMKTSAELIGKAMAGETGTLSRYGILLNDTERAIFKTGSESERVAVLLSKLNAKFGGLAETLADTASGAWAQMNNAIADAKESIGLAADQTDVLAGVFKDLTTLIQSLVLDQDALSGAFITGVRAALELSVVVLRVADTLSRMVRTLVAVGEAMALLSPTNLVNVFLSPLKSMKKMREIGQSVFDIWTDETALEKFGDSMESVFIRTFDKQAELVGGLDAKRQAELEKNRIAEETKNQAIANSKSTLDAQNSQFGIDKLDEQKEAGIANAVELADVTKTGLVDSVDATAKEFDSMWENSKEGSAEIIDAIITMQEEARVLNSIMTAAFNQAGGGTFGGKSGGGGGRGGGGSSRSPERPSDPGPSRSWDRENRGEPWHTGGPIMRAHQGMRIRDDEVPIIAQRGEFILRKSAAESIGQDTLQRLNRTGARGMIQRNEFNAGGVTINIIQAPGQSADATAQAVFSKFMEESERGVKVVDARGVRGL